MRLYELSLHFLLASLLVGTGRAFYIPGVAPTEYKKGDKLDIRVSE